MLLTVQPLFAQKQNDQIDVLIKKLGRDIKTRITVITLRGVVVADSEKDPKAMENHAMRPEVFQAMHGQTGSSLRHSVTVEQDMLYVAVPISVPASTVSGVLRLSLFMHDINRLLDDFNKGIVFIALIIIGIALLISLIVSRRLTNPIRTLSNASRKIASGDFNVRVFLKNNDELRDFAESFNNMAEKIRGLFEEVSLQKEELKNIITSMHESLLVLDHEGRIILINEGLKKIARAENLEGKFYWEVLRAPELGEVIKKVRRDKQDCIEEVILDAQTFLCSASFVAQKEEIVMILLDISAIKNMERMKKDFVINVSHELRTPLTAIKGFIETLTDEVSDTAHRRYLEIIKRHTDRLINIVKDLMELSKLENEQRIELEEVRLQDIIGQVQIIYEEQLKKKNLALIVELDDSLAPIKADPFKLEQVLINLIDNALKYTESGRIVLSARQDDTSTILCVEDTGLGMSADQLPRIFERFYVVDKSRSRQAGGTGLGLSIVKHIVQLHRGTITAQSMLGAGTKFIIRLPLKA